MSLWGEDQRAPGGPGGTCAVEDLVVFRSPWEPAPPPPAAIKVVKNKSAYHQQAISEIKLLQQM